MVVSVSVQTAPASRAPTPLENVNNAFFKGLTYGFAGLVVLLVFYIFWEIFRLGMPAMSERGLAFITGTTWNPNTNEYGILPEIWGTLYSSLLGILIGSVFGIAVAIFLCEGFVASAVFKVLSV